MSGLRKEMNMERKIVAGLFISLDGVVDSPESAPHKWTNHEIMIQMIDGLSHADTVLVGPRTYNVLAEHWQNKSNDLPMARFLNNSPKYVVSKNQLSLTWEPASQIQGNFYEEIVRLKNGPGKNIQVPGSPRLVRALLKNGLLDELSLNICPVVVGAGMHLFEELGNQIKFDLVESNMFENGVLGVTYKPVCLSQF